MKRIHLILILHFILGVLVIFIFQGTGDAGDSIYHYLYAKYAPYHHWLFLDHWAKPVYVLIASPFAQFGFIGVKLLNLILVNITLYLTYSVAKQFKIKNSVLAAVFLLFYPLYFVLTFSGLTEPMFAFFLILSVFLYKKNHLFWTCFIISFLPFVRSEGLLFIGLIGLWLLLKRKWIFLPLLGIGSVIYAFAGWSFYGDLLWIFNKIPYANLEDKYGSGSISHFIFNLMKVVGLPLYLLFWMGIVRWIQLLLHKEAKFDLSFFVYGGVFVFLLAHSLFWYLGIFSSMGLIRVLICILPLVSLISLIGFNSLQEGLFKNGNRLKNLTRYSVVGLVIFWFFVPTSLPGSIDVTNKLELTTSQEMTLEVAEYLKEEEESSFRLVSNHPYLCEVLEIDCFDKTKKIFLKEKTLNNLKSNDIIVWESWLSVIEQDLPKSKLEKDPRLLPVFEITRTTEAGKIRQFSVYKVRLKGESNADGKK